MPKDCSTVLVSLLSWNFNLCKSIQNACRILNGEKPYCDYVKRPLKLQCDMHVRYYPVIYNPDMRELYGDDFKQYLRFQGLWDQKDEQNWRKGARLPVVPRGSTVVVHGVKGIYQYAVDKRTGTLKHPSSDVVALVEFFDPRTHRTVYGEYAWISVEGIRKEDTFVLHRYLKRAPWEPSSVPGLRAIQGAGYSGSGKVRSFSCLLRERSWGHFCLLDRSGLLACP